MNNNNGSNNRMEDLNIIRDCKWVNDSFYFFNMQCLLGSVWISFLYFILRSIVVSKL